MWITRFSEYAPLAALRDRNAASGADARSIDPDGGLGRDLVQRPHAANAVPRALVERRLALALVALGEPRHKELLRQRRQEDAAGLADRHPLVVVLEVHHLGDRPR